MPRIPTTPIEQRERFELRFMLPTVPGFERAELVGECVCIVSRALIPMGVDRIEIFGDGILAYVVVPCDPNIKLTFFKSVRENIQAQINALIERYVKTNAALPRPAWQDLERLAMFMEERFTEAHQRERLVMIPGSAAVDSAIAMMGRGFCGCEVCRLHRRMSGSGTLES